MSITTVEVSTRPAFDAIPSSTSSMIAGVSSWPFSTALSVEIAFPAAPLARSLCPEGFRVIWEAMCSQTQQ